MKPDEAVELLRQYHDQLGACIDQVGHPDYSLREMVTNLREIRNSMFDLHAQLNAALQPSDDSWTWKP